MEIFFLARLILYLSFLGFCEGIGFLTCFDTAFHSNFGCLDIFIIIISGYTSRTFLNSCSHLSSVCGFYLGCLNRDQVFLFRLCL